MLWTRNGVILPIDGQKYKVYQTVTSRASSTYENWLQIQLCSSPHDHTGNYTCIVSNVFGTSSGSTLIVGKLVVSHNYSGCVISVDTAKFCIIIARICHGKFLIITNANVNCSF